MTFQNSNADVFQLGLPSARPTAQAKHHQSDVSSDLHLCKYDAQTGSDCDDYSQTSSEGCSSQDSQFTQSSPVSSSSEDDTSYWQAGSQDYPQGQTTLEQNGQDWLQDKPCSLQAGKHVESTLHHTQHVKVPYRPKPSAQPVTTSTYITHPNHANAIASYTNVDNLHGRRGRSIGASAPPPQLRRDTDHTDAIVRMIVLFCANLINSIWCVPGNSDSTFPQPGSNVLPLQMFITETLRRSKTSYSTLQIALYYLILLKQCLPPLASASQSGQSGCRAMQCGRRMFLTALILASKYLQDRNYSARAWSKISGLPLKEINDNERRFLSIVCWDLHVPKATFENWSKIVLNVCRRSMDSDVAGCKSGPDRFPPGPGTGPNSQRQCLLSSMCKDVEALRSWWTINLQKLRTDIVKCGVKTEKFVESIAPFRDGPYLPRPVSENSFEDVYAHPFLDSESKQSSDKSRHPSIERSSQQFEPVSDLLHPAPPTAIPPQPTLPNLPTPQTTPQTGSSGFWTPKLADQQSKPYPRCRASASALSNAFRKHCPMANLETCPPPQPRDCPQVLQSCGQPQAVRTYAGSTSSLTSSPDSYVSDTFSIGSRSRSSSISSSASCSTRSSRSSADVAAKDASETFEGGHAPLDRMRYEQMHRLLHAQQQSLVRQGLHPFSEIARPQTAFKSSSAMNCPIRQPTSCRDSADVEVQDEGYFSDEHVKKQQEAAKQEAAQVLAGLRIDETAVRSRARPSLERSKTQIFKPRQEQDSKTQHLKRCRSETLESAQHPQVSIQDREMRSSIIPDGLEDPQGDTNTNKNVQQPTQQWAAPRKPLQHGTQNKRLALQISATSPASELAAQYLKYGMQPNRLGPVCH